MPAVISAVRAFQLTEASGHPLPSPLPLDLATQEVPYGAILRLEAEVQSDAPVYALDADIYSGDSGGRARLFPTRAGTFAGEFRMPTDLLFMEMRGVTEPPRFPLSGFPAQGFLPPGGGEHTLYLTPVPLSTKPTWPLGGDLTREANLHTSETSFRVGSPPGPGGAAPKIVALETGLPDNRVRIGQPWLATAKVEDADDDVLGVIFCVTRGRIACWWSMRDDGSMGDEQAGDGVYPFLRAGGDWWDSSWRWEAGEVPVTFSVQAVDLHGNWSQPEVFEYRLCYDQPPLWMEEPTAGAPNILECGVSREEGTFDHPRMWAKCDTPGAWVCARLLIRSNEVWALYDDGKGPDAVAGDGVYTSVAGFGRRQRDIVFYAAPRSGPLCTGERMAATGPALVEG